MGFFQNIKQKLGFVGVEAKFEGVEGFSKDGKTITGTLVITSKTDQKVKGIEVKLEEQYTTKQGDSETTKKFELGSWKDASAFELKAGDTKKLTFSFNYAFLKSQNDKLMEGGKVGKVLGSLGKFASGEKSKYEMWATVDLEGVAFDPNCHLELKLK